MAEITSGLRDTNAFYADSDPMQWVDQSLVKEIESRCGRSLLDLGCGVGGYARTLMNRGYAVTALDVNPGYVNVARSIGVDARVYDGGAIPLDDASVDTIFMVEVLEHVPQPEQLLAEVFRVARKNVVVTVPNNTQAFTGPVVWNHMLDVDHKHFFTADSLKRLLRADFPNVEVRQIVPCDRLLLQGLLPKWLFRVYDRSLKLRLVREKHSFRLLACASK